ncbi:hypothetical protein [uncultured Nitratireductor sp.]|uniref:hypothetical protein n=1 Tax=uncultured Nitratireductor sp. TaxID=520953 RepID=UPI0026365678|nr:hypothetical protein [uncultured Nitratireductor sp.]
MNAWPRGLRRAQAAAYLGISPSHFDKQRALGVIPAPRRMFDVDLYDRHELDLLFDSKATPVAANDNESSRWEEHWHDIANPSM